MSKVVATCTECGHTNRTDITWYTVILTDDDPHVTFDCIHCGEQSDQAFTFRQIIPLVEHGVTVDATTWGFEQ